jgi:hypothetical protein
VLEEGVGRGGPVGSGEAGVGLGLSLCAWRVAVALGSEVAAWVFGADVLALVVVA